ncbi:MAG TPA: hypothetical protein VG455_05520 [Acidimicrobiales bacterium]|nr:hypothetical protein [Acidimicrobiales bacterium]
MGLTILRLEDHSGGGGMDGPFDDPELYAIVHIDGQRTETEPLDADELVLEPNWHFSTLVDANRTSIPIKIEIWDEDGLLKFEDEHADLNPVDGEMDLSLDVDLEPCEVRGSVSGPCHLEMEAQGDDGDDDKGGDFDEDVRIVFRVTTGLNVRCMHSPVWPRPGDRVTITAESLTGALTPQVADHIEIRVESGAVHTHAGADRTSHTTGPVPGPTLRYTCLAKYGGTSTDTGWRAVDVGGPREDGGPVAIVTTGDVSQRADIVFVPDRTDYGTDLQRFAGDVGNVIRDAFYGYELFLSHQHYFNFWISSAPGHSGGYDGTNCTLEGPPGLDDTPYLFADAALVLHTRAFRDCARPGAGLLSAELGDHNVVRHEIGHVPFGLADEYCKHRPGANNGSCDGGYFEQPQTPNVYESLQRCRDDAPSVGVSPDVCQEFDPDRADYPPEARFSTSDPAAEDLMVDNTRMRRLDLRRIRWYFGQCDLATREC